MHGSFDNTHAASRPRSRSESSPFATDITPPPSPWTKHFLSASPLPIVKRPRLLARTMLQAVRWSSIIGVPGHGRSTLLAHIAEAHRAEGTACVTVWEPQNPQALSLALGVTPGQDIAAYAQRFQQLARTSTNGRIVLLIDDFDWCVDRGELPEFIRLLHDVPELNIVTVTIDPIERPGDRVSLSELSGLSFREVPSKDLRFTFFEFGELCKRTVDEGLLREVPPRRELQRLAEQADGLSLAVALALDRLIDNPTHAADDRTIHDIATHAVHLHMLGSSPLTVLHSGIAFMLWRLSFLPRFSNETIRWLFPKASAAMVREIVNNPSLESNKTSRGGEYAWADGAWRLFRELNASANSERRELADQLLKAGALTASFEQYLLAEDYVPAENLLRERFLTIFENLSPETAYVLSGISDNRLKHHPMTRVFKTLLIRKQHDETLRATADLLHRLSNRAANSPHTLLIRAVRAVVLLHVREWRAADALAVDVIRRKARLGHLADQADRTCLEEAALIATLVLFERGTHPQDENVLTPVGDSRYLHGRSLLAQRLLDVVHCLPVNEDDIRHDLFVPGRRWLVFSEARNRQEITNFTAHDAAIDALINAVDHDQDAASSTLSDTGAEPMIPQMLRTALPCRNYLIAGNLPGAIAAAHDPTVPEPMATTLRATTLILSGDLERAATELSPLLKGWGPRTSAVATLLSIGILLRQGKEEAARLSFADAIAEHPEVALVPAATLLTHEDVFAFAKISPQAERIAHVAYMRGVFASGKLISASMAMQPLSEKEMSVLLCLRKGLNTRQIAEHLFLSVNTIRSHIRSISKKLGASGQREILARAEELLLFDRAES